jgi:hypothetical protein
MGSVAARASAVAKEGGGSGTRTTEPRAAARSTPGTLWSFLYHHQQGGARAGASATIGRFSNDRATYFGVLPVGGARVARARGGLLPVSHPDDPSEREAGQVASRVMSQGAPAEPIGIRRDGGKGTCSACRASARFGIQRACAECAGAPATAAAPVASAAPPSAGALLPVATRRDMERRFGGADFTQVRVHSDPGAGSLDALAYTVGSDIYFAPGRFEPGTAHGDLLLAHELTHVLQQGGGGGALGIHRAPEGLYRWMAGGCCVPSVPSTTIGTWIHTDIEALMYGINPFMQAEVPIPGAAPSGVGFTDLYLSALPFLQPVGPTWRMPGRVGLPFPPAHAPVWAGMGSIKPITYGMGAGHLDLLRYVTAFNTYYAASGGSAVGGTALPYPTNPLWMVPGIPFVHAPPWLPQDLHIFTMLDGLYWYFCTPSLLATGLAIWLARYIAQKLRDFLDEMARILRPIAHAVAAIILAMFESLMFALRAIADFIKEHWLAIILVILAVIAVILIVIFWEVIAGILAGAMAYLIAAGETVAGAGAIVGAFIMRMLAQLAPLFSPAAARGLAGAVTTGALLFPAGARAATPQDFSEQSAADQPPIPGGVQPQRPLPSGGSDAPVTIDAALALMNRSATLDPRAPLSGIPICDEAQRIAGAFAFGGPVASLFGQVKSLLQTLASSPRPPTGGGAGGAASTGEGAGGAQETGGATGAGDSTGRPR